MSGERVCDISVDAVDQRGIAMVAEILDGPRGLPVVEYRMPADRWRGGEHVVICFGGGGSSGVLFALIAEVCAEAGIDAVAFDMPGHTAAGLLGQLTPSQDLLSASNGTVRRSVTEFMVERWAQAGGHLDVLSHSAGIVDVARISARWNTRIANFVITGAGIPGWTALRAANRAAAQSNSAEPIRLSSMLRTRLLPTGLPDIHFGAAAAPPALGGSLARYQGREHIGAVLPLLSARAVVGAPWRGREVALIGSAGDLIVPAELVMAARPVLARRGARVAVRIIEARLPHMFMCWREGATAIRETLLSRGPTGWT